MFAVHAGPTRTHITIAAVCAGVLGLALLCSLALYCWLRKRHASQPPGQAYASEPVSSESSHRRGSQRSSTAGAADKAAAAAQAAALLRSRSTLGLAAPPLATSRPGGYKHSLDYGTPGQLGGMMVIPVATCPSLIPPNRSRASTDLTASHAARARRHSAHLMGAHALEAAAFAASLAAAAAAADAGGPVEGRSRGGSASVGEVAASRSSLALERGPEGYGASGPAAPRRAMPVAGVGSRSQRRSVDNYIDRLQQRPVQQ
jgi:hypothetical protein